MDSRLAGLWERTKAVVSAARRRLLSPRPLPKAVRTTAIIVLGVLALAVAFDVGTASPRLCASCHEMQLRASSWAESGHVTVACVKCHQPPTAWHALPRRVIDRGRRLARDVVAHFSGEFDDPVDAPSADTFPMSDEVCLQCHDPGRKATSGFRILIDHVEHAKRNGSCVSCHVRTAHPIETRGRAMSLMTQCFTCHGTAEQPAASAECSTCHPAGYELVPASHQQASWARGHGDTSVADPKQCTMCHERPFCDDCHGLAMPHPEGWAAGPQGHAVLAQQDPAVCERCHGRLPDLCTMCHHTSYDPMQGTWIDQHDLEVEQEGSAYCERCHKPAYCSFCHTSLVVDGE